MISSVTADAAAAYEQLRNHVLNGSSPGGHFGLALLLREGLAAWLDRSATGFRPAELSIVAAGAPAVLFPQLQTGIVAVLADIVWTIRQEMNP